MRHKAIKILVCIKQVPESDAPVEFANTPHGAVVLSDGPFRINRSDACALEAAIRLKESHEATVVDVVSVGPPRVEEILRRAMGMGADNAVLIRTPPDIMLSPMTVAGWIAGYAENASYDLVLTGVMSEDLMHGITGQTIAALLGWPSAWGVVSLDFVQETGVVAVEKEIENGRRLAHEIRLPGVLAVQTGIHRPRYPSLSNLLRANAKDLHVISPEFSSPAHARQETVAVAETIGRKQAHMVPGPLDAKAKWVCRYLSERGFI